MFCTRQVWFRIPAERLSAYQSSGVQFPGLVKNLFTFDKKAHDFNESHVTGGASITYKEQYGYPNHTATVNLADTIWTFKRKLTEACGDLAYKVGGESVIALRVTFSARRSRKHANLGW